MTIKHIFTVIFIILVSIPNYVFGAGVDTARYCNNKGVIFFGNGVLNTVEDSKVGEHTLKKNIRQDDLILYSSLEYQLSYNPTAGFLTDVFEFFYQRGEDPEALWKMYLMDNASLSDADRDVIAGILANYTRMAENYVTEYHAQNYRDRIAEGKKVIVVAHSQGNLFANRAGSLLTAEELESFSIVGVANVDNRVLKGSYVTLDIDWAVALARYRFPDTLPPNLTDPPSADDPFNHKFVGTYMRSGTNAQTAIKGLVPVLYDALLTPAQKQKDGIITVQLSWGNPTDMDLHVFEPGGWHVYWSSPQGMSGKLDVDRWSYGPEHYYVACDAVAVGRYRIGVNYYDDNNTSGPSSYWINVKAGDTEQRIPLAGYSSQLRAQFTAGDYSPQMEGYIDVTGSAEEGYQFEVGSF